jgi:GNAT superfamily N-acetyltransferase
MVTSSLSFHPLSSPLPAKVLRAFRKDAGWPETNGADKESQGPHGKVQWISVESEKTRIGIARLEMAAPEFCYVSEVIIASKFRGKGIGHWLFKSIEQYCAQAGIRRLLLQPKAGSTSFYDSLQFVPDPFVKSYLKKDINPFQRKMFVPK